jgi:hypothetical protein
MPKVTVMKAIRPARYAGDSPVWTERPTCIAVARGSSPLVGSLTRASFREGILREAQTRAAAGQSRS